MLGEERFERAWGSLGASVTRYCAFATGSLEVGEDLAAETFARFLTHGAAVREDRTEAWLFTVARNLCASHHRSQSRLLRLADKLAGAGGEPEAPDAARDGLDPELLSAVRGLRESERLAIYLRVVEERPYAEVAQVLGRSEGATRMLVLRSLRRLRTRLTTAAQLAVAAEGDA